MGDLWRHVDEFKAMQAQRRAAIEVAEKMKTCSS